MSLALDELMAVNDELVALVKAGVPLERQLTLSARELGGPAGRLLNDLSARLEGGVPLQMALALAAEAAGDRRMKNAAGSLAELAEKGPPVEPSSPALKSWPPYLAWLVGHAGHAAEHGNAGQRSRRPGRRRIMASSTGREVGHPAGARSARRGTRFRRAAARDAAGSGRLLRKPASQRGGQALLVPEKRKPKRALHAGEQGLCCDRIGVDKSQWMAGIEQCPRDGICFVVEPRRVAAWLGCCHVVAWHPSQTCRAS